MSLSISVSVSGGTDINDAFEEASRLAHNLALGWVDFDFNGIKCAASPRGKGFGMRWCATVLTWKRGERVVWNNRGDSVEKPEPPNCPGCVEKDPGGTHSYGTKQHPEPEGETKVKRWAMFAASSGSTGSPPCLMTIPSNEGEWVKFTDHAAALDAMRARAEKAEADLEEARGLLLRWNAWFASIDDDAESFLSRTRTERK